MASLWQEQSELALLRIVMLCFCVVCFLFCYNSRAGLSVCKMLVRGCVSVFSNLKFVVVLCSFVRFILCV